MDTQANGMTANVKALQYWEEDITIYHGKGAHIYKGMPPSLKVSTSMGNVDILREVDDAIRDKSGATSLSSRINHEVIRRLEQSAPREIRLVKDTRRSYTAWQANKKDIKEWVERADISGFQPFPSTMKTLKVSPFRKSNNARPFKLSVNFLKD